MEEYARWLHGKGITASIFQTLTSEKLFEWATLYENRLIQPCKFLMHYYSLSTKVPVLCIFYSTIGVITMGSSNLLESWSCQIGVLL